VPTRKITPEGSGEGTTYCAVFAAYDEGGQITNVQGPWQIDGVRIPDLAHYLASHAPGEELDTDGAFPCELLALRSRLFMSPPEATSAEQQCLEHLSANPKDPSRWHDYFALMSQSGVAHPGLRLLEQALKECTKLPVGELSWGVDWKDSQGNSFGLTTEQLKGLGKPVDFLFDPSKSLIQVSEHLLQASIHTDTWENWGNRDLYNRWIIFDDRWASANPDLANCILRFQARWDVLSD